MQTTKTKGCEYRQMGRSRVMKYLAKRIMLLAPNHPTLWGHLGNETFRHPEYVNGEEEMRQRIMHAASQFRYNYEQEIPFQIYFKHDLVPFFEGKDVLDLGCMTGGRAVAWAEKYRTRVIHGIDVTSEYAEAATKFARRVGINAFFAVARGENIPVRNDTYHTIVSYDVLEHVRDIRGVLSECRRVLKIGGHLILVFPSFYQPLEHHLSLVTRTPAMHWLFSRDILMQAYNEIISERGESAQWYARKSVDREPWEALDQINGTSAKSFRRVVMEQRWGIIEESYPGLFLSGRRARRSRVFKLMSRMNGIFAHLSGLREIFADRIVFILEKV